MKSVSLCFVFCASFCAAQLDLGNTVLDETVVATNLDVPWDMTYGPDGQIWFTELSGTINKMNPDTYVITTVHTIQDVAQFGYSVGLHSIVLHPDFNTNHLLYVHYTNSTSTSQIVRLEYDQSANTLINPTTILANIPAGDSHNGSRMLFLNGKLLISLGDAYSNSATAQDVNSLNGKILRMNPDGTIPADNPTAGSYIWSLGHRNPQGLCLGNGKLYSSEHGHTIDDEINIIEVNRNYGWPNVEGVCNTAAEITFCTANNVKEPIRTWTPTIAPCGLDYYGNPIIPEWNHSLLLVALKGKKLIQLKLSPDGLSVEGENTFLENEYGRLRDVLVIPDGRVFLCTSNHDYIGVPQATDDRIIELKVSDVGLGEKNNTTFRIYPVPASEVIHVETQLNADYCRVINSEGKELLLVNFTPELDVSQLTPGLYFLELLNHEENRISIQRLVIE